MTDEYRSVAAELRHETERVKGSRFVATVAPAASEAAADAFVARVREELDEASHHGWAWRVGLAGESFRFSDDGEPSGSAGRPILAQIEGHGVTNVALVVTRWFGGTKLGVGGLMRAYGGAAGEALERAGVRTVAVTVRVELEFPYACTGAIDGLLAATGYAPKESDYGSSVRLVLDVPRRERAAFEAEVRERTAGRARVEVSA